MYIPPSARAASGRSLFAAGVEGVVKSVVKSPLREGAGCAGMLRQYLYFCTSNASKLEYLRVHVAVAVLLVSGAAVSGAAAAAAAAALVLK